MRPNPKLPQRRDIACSTTAPQQAWSTDEGGSNPRELSQRASDCLGTETGDAGGVRLRSPSTLALDHGGLRPRCVPAGVLVPFWSSSVANSARSCTGRLGLERSVVPFVFSGDKESHVTAELVEEGSCGARGVQVELCRDRGLVRSLPVHAW